VPHRNKSSRNRSKNSSGRYGAEAGMAYNSHLRTFVQDGRVPEAAEDARKALDGPEADDLFEAENDGKARAELSVSDRARAVVSRVSRAVKAALHELRN
jgi:hypothetical protein